MQKDKSCAGKSLCRSVFFLISILDVWWQEENKWWSGYASKRQIMKPI